MLTKKHPKKRAVPPVQLSAKQFIELCKKTLGNLGPDTTYSISFQGTDGSDITASDVSEVVRAADDTIPNIIVMPTVKAESVSGNVVELRPEPTQVGNQQNRNYILAVTGTSQVWAEGVMEATLQWLNRKRTPLFRYYYSLAIGFGVLAVCCLILAFAFGLNISADNRLYFSPVALPIRISAAIAGVCFLFATLQFPKSFPVFSVVVRLKERTAGAFSLAALLGVLASVVIIIEGIASLFHH
jgi:hypothetical protein